MFHIHGQKLVLELHEYMLDLLWWWLLGHAHKHIIMVSPEIDILKIESTIIQRRFECREAFLLLLFFNLFFDWGHYFLTLSSQPYSQPTQSTMVTHIPYAFFSTLKYIISLSLSCFTCFMS